MKTNIYKFFFYLKITQKKIVFYFLDLCQSNVLLLYEFPVVHVTDQFSVTKEKVWTVMEKFIYSLIYAVIGRWCRLI